MNRSEALARLIEKRWSLVESARNQAAQALFLERVPGIVHDKFRERPRPLTETAGKIPVILCLDRALWSQLLGFPLDRFYLDPACFLENQLRMDIYHLENLPDDHFSDRFIPIWGGPGFEASLLGMQQEYAADSEPGLRHQPIVEELGDLRRLPDPDFTTTGPMPQVMRFFEQVQAQLEGSGLQPIPPGWIRGPLGVAEALRGVERLILDSVLNPELVHGLFRKVVDFRKAWSTMRAGWLGYDQVSRGLLYNDEVQVPMISPQVYRNFVLPYEKEWHDHGNGLLYWHSCGDATPFVPLVAELPHIEMIHCGPFTEMEEVVRTFARRSALEIALRQKEDFIDASDEAMRAAIERAVSLCKKHDAKAAMIRVTAYASECLSAGDTLDKAKRWSAMAQDVTCAAM